jgi:hypothetical protein
LGVDPLRALPQVWRFGCGGFESSVSQENSSVSTAALKIKEKKPGQRACDERDAKGELCCGHLKRWYYYHPLRLAFTEEEESARKEFGKDAEIYRCERCHTVYRRTAEDLSTAGQKFEVHPVNLWGDFFRKKAR